MFCPKCGTKNPEDGKFCRSCGSDLAVVSAALSGGLPSKLGEFGLDASCDPKEALRRKDPHEVYGDDEGFGVPRGTAIIPDLGVNSFGVTSAVGSSRTPTTYNLDLGVYYPIKFSENMQLRFTADWFNVTNTQRAVILDQTFQVDSGVAGIPPVSNPFYGAGLAFQYPSALRLGAKFSF